MTGRNDLWFAQDQAEAAWRSAKSALAQAIATGGVPENVLEAIVRAEGAARASFATATRLLATDITTGDKT